MAGFQDVWAIAPEERIKHDNQFYLMNPIAGFLSGEQVKVFFLQSGLPQNMLGKIWQLSDINADGKMDKGEFSIAMHLIKKALQGFDVPNSLPPTLLPNMPTDATFNPSMNSGLVGGVYGMAPNPGVLYSSATLPYPAVVSSDHRHFSTISKALVSSSGEWSITPAQRLKYKQSFGNHDVAHKGYLTGLEAKGILSLSGLTHHVLAQIWSLADIDTDGNLSPDEFCVAMFLIDQAKSGFPVPSVLPLDLVPPSYRKTRRTSESVAVGLPPNSHTPAAAGVCKLGVSNELVSNFNIVAANLNMSGSETSSSSFSESEAARIVTFEDKRKENFDRGQAELERRRAMLRDQQLQESEERIAAERAEHEKREKHRQEQEMKRQMEHEKQMEKQRQLEMEKEEQRIRAFEQKEAARKELERQRQLEWEKQRRDQFVSDKNHEETFVDNLKQETGRQRLDFEAQEIKKSELLGRIEQTKMNISDLSTSIQTLKHSSLSKTTEIDVLKAELEEVEMRLVAAQQESIRMSKQINTPDNIADRGLENLLKDHFKTKEKLDDLKKKIEIIETTCKFKKTQISELQVKMEQVKKMCDTNQDTNDLNAFSTFESKPSQPEQKNGNIWAFNSLQNDSFSPFDSTVNWSSAFPAEDSLAFKESKPNSDAWASFDGNDLNQANTWTADFNSFPKNPETEEIPEKYRALYRFDAKNPDELSLVEGDIVSVHQKDQVRAEPGWTIGSLNGKEGCFPQAYVSLVASDQVPTHAEDVVERSDGGPKTEAASNNVSFDISKTETQSTGTFTSASISSLVQGNKKHIKVQALYQWQAKKDNHLSFLKGDIITVLSQQEMWWFGELDQKVGWFPKSYVKVFGEPEATYSPTPPEISSELMTANKPAIPHEPKPSSLSQNAKKLDLEDFIVVAMFTYSSNVPGDLTFNQGDVFSAQKTDEEWWTGTLNDKTGIFPASYVQQMETLNATRLQENRKPEIASVIATYPATGPEQLTLQPGQLIHVRKKSPSGWWEGELQVKGQKRRIGWFPANYVKLLGASNRNTPEPGVPEPAKDNRVADSPAYIGHAMAMYSYVGQTEEDLSFQEGAVINIIDQTSNDWWKGEVNGSVGIFPANYVSLTSHKSLNESSLNALS